MAEFIKTFHSCQGHCVSNANFIIYFAINHVYLVSIQCYNRSKKIVKIHVRNSLLGPQKLSSQIWCTFAQIHPLESTILGIQMLLTKCFLPTSQNIAYFYQCIISHNREQYPVLTLRIVPLSDSHLLCGILLYPLLSLYSIPSDHTHKNNHQYG